MLSGLNMVISNNNNKKFNEKHGTFFLSYKDLTDKINKGIVRFTEKLKRRKNIF